MQIFSAGIIFNLLIALRLLFFNKLHNISAIPSTGYLSHSTRLSCSKKRIVKPCYQQISQYKICKKEPKFSLVYSKTSCEDVTVEYDARIVEENHSVIMKKRKIPRYLFVLLNLFDYKA